MTNPASAVTAISSQVQPSRHITLARPGMSPPPGNTPAASTPLLRVTGITVESGLIATADRASGVKSPVSAETLLSHPNPRRVLAPLEFRQVDSTVAATELISTRPSVVTAEIIPG